MSGRLFSDIYDGTPSFDAHAYKAASETADVIAIKASEGETGRQGHSFAVQAHKAGLSVIHYHFARPDDGNSPEAEAENFIAAMGSDLHAGDWVALDYERFTGHGASADVDWINRFWRHVHSKLEPKHLPDRSWLYASRSPLQDFIATGKLIIHRLWDADWSSGPNIKTGPYWTIARQRSGDGVGPGPHTLPGIGGANCDVDELSDEATAKPHH